MIRPQPRSYRTEHLLPHTTLFVSGDHPSGRRHLCPARPRHRVGPRGDVPPCCRTTRLLRRPQSLGCHWRTARARSPRRPHPPRPPSPQSRNAAPAARRLRSKSMEILVSRSRLAGTPPHYVYRVLVPRSEEPTSELTSLLRISYA